MTLVNTRTGHGVAAIPSNGNWSFGEWLENQDVQIIHDKSDPRWSDEGNNIIINGERCRLEDLAVVNQTVSDLDLAMMFNEALMFYDPQSYYEVNYMAAYGPGSPDTYADNMCSSKGYTSQGHKVNQGVASTIRQKDISGRVKFPATDIFLLGNNASTVTVASLSEALLGDFALYLDSAHVGMIVGRNAVGKLLVCHCSYGLDIVMMTEFAAAGFATVERQIRTPE